MAVVGRFGPPGVVGGAEKERARRPARHHRGLPLGRWALRIWNSGLPALWGCSATRPANIRTLGPRAATTRPGQPGGISRGRRSLRGRLCTSTSGQGGDVYCSRVRYAATGKGSRNVDRRTPLVHAGRCVGPGRCCDSSGDAGTSFTGRFVLA